MFFALKITKSCKPEMNLLFLIAIPLVTSNLLVSERTQNKIRINLKFEVISKLKVEVMGFEVLKMISLN